MINFCKGRFVNNSFPSNLKNDLIIGRNSFPDAAGAALALPALALAALALALGPAALGCAGAGLRWRWAALSSQHSWAVLALGCLALGSARPISDHHAFRLALPLHWLSNLQFSGQGHNS